MSNLYQAAILARLRAYGAARIQCCMDRLVVVRVYRFFFAMLRGAVHEDRVRKKKLHGRGNMLDAA